MAIRIVEDKPDPKVVREVVCKQCGVKLEYLPIDILQGKHYDYGGGCDAVEYIKCPKCQADITLRTF